MIKILTGRKCWRYMINLLLYRAENTIRDTWLIWTHRIILFRSAFLCQRMKSLQVGWIAYWVTLENSVVKEMPDSDSGSWCVQRCEWEKLRVSAVSANSRASNKRCFIEKHVMAYTHFWRKSKPCSFCVPKMWKSPYNYCHYYYYYYFFINAKPRQAVVKLADWV